MKDKKNFILNIMIYYTRKFFRALKGGMNVCMGGRERQRESKISEFKM